MVNLASCGVRHYLVDEGFHNDTILWNKLCGRWMKGLDYRLVDVDTIVLGG